MSNSNAVSTVLGNFGGQLGLVNTGMGMKNADGTFNVSGTLQGLAATAESQLGNEAAHSVEFPAPKHNTISPARHVPRNNGTISAVSSIVLTDGCPLERILFAKEW